MPTRNEFTILSFDTSRVDLGKAGHAPVHNKRERSNHGIHPTRNSNGTACRAYGMRHSPQVEFWAQLCDRLMDPQVGMDLESVLSLMGEPYSGNASGDDTEFLFYETNHWASDELKRLIPILIQDGKVAGWGEQILQ